MILKGVFIEAPIPPPKKKHASDSFLKDKVQKIYLNSTKSNSKSAKQMKVSLWLTNRMHFNAFLIDQSEYTAFPSAE